MNEILRALRNLKWATVALYLVVAGLTIWAILYARTTRHALCQLDGDLKARVAATETYLRETPNAIPGITPAQIRLDLDNRRRTLRALSGLGCR